MDFCILIHLSRFTISFSYYTKDNGRFESYGEEPDRPLAIWFCGKNVILGTEAKREAKKGTLGAYYDLFREMSRQDSFEYAGEQHKFNKLVLYAIRAGLKEFFVRVMKNYYGDLEENISSLPLLLVVNPDIENNDRNLLIRQLRDNGFCNIEEIDENRLIRSTFHGGTDDASTFVLSSNGMDLHGIVLSGDEMNVFFLKNAGKDPRIDKLVDLIWKRTGAENNYLVKENELTDLRNAALRFIQSGQKEFDGNIVLSDGYDYHYFLDRQDLNLYTQQDGGKIIRDIVDKVSAYGDKRHLHLILKNQAATNKFLQDLLRPEFPDIVVIGKEERALLWSKILEYAKGKDFHFGTPARTPRQPLTTTSPSNHPAAAQNPKPSADKFQPSGVQPMAGGSSGAVEGVSAAASPSPQKADERKAKMLKKSFEHQPDKREACKEIKAFLDAMHQKGLTCFDDDLMPLLGTPTPADEPKPSAGSVPTALKRDFNQTVRLINSYIRRAAFADARKEIETLQQRMNGFFASEIKQLLSQVQGQDAAAPKGQKSIAPKSTAPSPPKSNLSDGDKLAKAGDFKKAREAYRAEGNTQKADACTSIIKFERFLGTYEKDVLDKSISKTVARQRVSEVQANLSAYKALGIATQRLDKLIMALKSIK